MKLHLNFKKLILLFLFLAFTFVNTSFVFANPAKTNLDSETKILISNETEKILYEKSEKPILESQAGILIDSKSGKVLYGKNQNKRMYPASTTKILTAILTLENCNLDDVATVSYDAIMSIPEGYSTAELQVEEHITIESLLELLLLLSANDAANVLAEHVGGSIESFVSMMNTKLHELDLSNTHFTNAYGKHDENHYSTTHDLAVIMQYCMKNENFRKLCGKASCTIPATDKYEARSYISTNKLILPDDSYYYSHATCGKTGFTSQAGYCLVSCSYKDDLELICVIFGGNTIKNPHTRFTESKNLFEYGYYNYSIRTLLSQNDIVTNIEVENASKDTKNLDLLANTSFQALLENSFSSNELELIVDLKPNIKAPIKQGDVLGSVSCMIDEKEYKTDLIAAHSVEQSKMIIYIIEFGIAGLILILILLYFVLFHKTKNDKK